MSRKSIFYSSLFLLILELGMVGLSLTLLLMNLGVVKVAKPSSWGNGSTGLCLDPNHCSLWQFSAHVLSSDCSIKECSNPNVTYLNNPDLSCVPAKYYMGVQLAVSLLLVVMAAFTCIRSRKLSAASKYIWLFVALPAMIVVTCFGVFMFIEYHSEKENPALLVLGFIWSHFFLPIFLVAFILSGMRGYLKPSNPHKESESPPYGRTIEQQASPHVTSKSSRSVPIVTKDPARPIERPPSVPLSSFQIASPKPTVASKPSFSPSRDTVTSRDTDTSRGTSPHGIQPVSLGHSSRGHDNPALALEERQNVGTQNNDWQNRTDNDWQNRTNNDWQTKHEEERARSQSPKKYSRNNTADIQEILRHGEGRRSRTPSVVSSGGAWSPGGSRRGSRTIKQPETPAIDYNTMIQPPKKQQHHPIPYTIEPPKPSVPARKPRFGYDSRPFSYLTPQFRPEALDVQAMKDHHVDIVKSLSDDMTRNSFKRKEEGRASRNTSPLDTHGERALSPKLERATSPPRHPPGYTRVLSPEMQRALSPELERASSPHGTIV